MAVKVKDSFELQLPTLRMKSKDHERKEGGKKRVKLNGLYTTVKESSKSTTAAPAIAGYVEENAVDLVIMARQKLRSKDVQEYMPGIEQKYLLVNEADVVRAAGQHLVYSINMLLPELFPDVDLRILCNSEIAANQESRFDMHWLLCRPGKADVTAAILEYKAPYVIHRNEFERGKFQAGEAEKKMSVANRQKSGTLLEGNAIPLSKQASKYSAVCMDIALFDWSWLMLFDLTSWDRDNNRPARGVFYKESENIGTFRLALLGFVLRAIGRHL